MKNNCWNCKHCSNQYRNPFAKTWHYCIKQQAWIYKLNKECPKFEIKLFSRIFGDKTPKSNTFKGDLVGGCKK